MVKANTFESYTLVGVKQDVSPIITNITPAATPFLSSIGSEKVTQTTPQWQEDTLDPAEDNAQVEGFDASARALKPTKMRQNYTQILNRTIRVSGTTDATTSIGRAKESAYQMAKQMAAIKKDLEFAMVGVHQAAVLGDGATVPRRMASAFAQLDPSVILDVSSGETKKARALEEADLMNMNQLLYQIGADVTTILIRPSTAPVLATFAYSSDGGNTPGRVRDIGSSKTLVNVVDVYESPFGKQTVRLDRILKDGDLLLYSPQYWKELTLRPWFRETLAKTGDSLPISVTAEKSLKHTNYKASGMITGLTPDGVAQI